MIKLKTVLLLLFMIVLSACSSQVTRPEKAEATRTVIKALQDFSVEISPDTKLQIAEDVNFDINELRSNLDRVLNEKNLLAPNGDYRLKVMVNDIRVRSTISAVMLGFFAGNDHLRGEVIVLNLDGEPVYTFEASASYALGGFGGGQDTSRMNWLYGEFSEIVASELVLKREQ